LAGLFCKWRRHRYGAGFLGRADISEISDATELGQAKKPDSTRSFRLAVTEGCLFQTGMSVTDDSLVLAVMLNSLGAPAVIVGSISAIRFAGWSLPQLFVANVLESRRFRMPVYRWNNGVRFPIYFLLAAIIGFMGESNPALAIGLFLPIYGLTRVVAGIAAAARTDIIGKVLEPERLSEFFAARALTGSVGAFLVGFLISFMLGDKGPPYPWNFAALIALSGVIFGFAWSSFARIQEGPSRNTSPSHTLREQLAVSKGVLAGDANFRQYLWVRICLSFVQIALPFYALYAIEGLGIEDSLVGVYLSMMTFARFIANPLWGKIGRERGSHVVLRLTSVMGIAAPLLAIGLPWLGRLTGQVDAPAFAYVFGLVFLVNGIAASGRLIAFHSYLLDMAPTDSRPTYVGLTNTIRGLMDFLTIAAGQAVDLWGYSNVFVFAAVLIAVGAALSFRLEPSSYVAEAAKA
jgi:hypothetical protein